METLSRQGIVRLVVVATLVVVYFIAFPQDVPAVISPVERVLTLSNAVSPWFYGVIAIAILCYTAMGIWGGKPGTSSAARHGAPLT